MIKKRSKEMKKEIRKINFKGTEYLVSEKAYSLNDGEYYIAYRPDEDKKILIPTDHREVHRVD